MVRPRPNRQALTQPLRLGYTGRMFPLTNLATGTALAEIASLMGDVGRANMLVALMDGRALTAGELSRHAGVMPQTASGHLAKLADLRLVIMERQGRHRYYRLASTDVAGAIEALMALAGASPTRHRPVSPRDEALRAARTCYDHLAGRLGVALAERLQARGHLVMSDGGCAVTDNGRTFFHAFEIDLDSGSTRPLCRTCLDWSERRPHIAGRLGAALLERALALGWIKRQADGRAVTVTQAGRSGFAQSFDVEI